jgi:hypothetical protein
MFPGWRGGPTVANCYGYAEVLRLPAGILLGQRVAGGRPSDDLDRIRLAAPSAANLLDVLAENRGLFDGRLTGEVEVPELFDARGAHHIESGQIPAVGATPAVRVIGQFTRHAGEPTRSSDRPRCRRAHLGS